MLKRLLITGAGGKLGSMLRGRLGHVAETIRLSDIVDLGSPAPHEELVRCALEDEQAVHDLVGAVTASSISAVFPSRRLSIR